MNPDLKTLISEMKSIETYFMKYSQGNKLFEPEHKAAVKINEIISKDDSINDDSVRLILQIIDETERIDHFNGSGWHDYKLHLLGLFRHRSVQFERK